MSFLPLWPNLQPRVTDPLWFNADRPCDDESEVAALESELQTWRDRIRAEGYDHVPIGKSLSDFRGSEEEEEEEEEEEGEGEEEEESDTHEEEEEELDEIDMEQKNRPRKRWKSREEASSRVSFPEELSYFAQNQKNRRGR